MTKAQEAIVDKEFEFLYKNGVGLELTALDASQLYKCGKRQTANILLTKQRTASGKYALRDVIAAFRGW